VGGRQVLTPIGTWRFSASHIGEQISDYCDNDLISNTWLLHFDAVAVEGLWNMAVSGYIE